MPPRKRQDLGMNVFDAAIGRLMEVYEQGHRVVVSFSAGKDSGACLELAVIAARATGRLPVDVIMRDEEVMFPGTFEYAERVAQRPEINFHWIYACQPIINVFDRQRPYWWVFDPSVDPDDWVRKPPAIAYQIPDLNIQAMTVPARFPPAEGKSIYSVVGLRVQESIGRLYGTFSAGGHIVSANSHGVKGIRPIYDWTDGDIWRAHNIHDWDYNKAYDVMHQMGISRSRLRIAPPTMHAASVESLKMAAAAWPRWFDRVAKRLPGVRTAAMFGKRAVTPRRRQGETWETCFRREVLGEAPPWIRDRAQPVVNRMLSTHAHHSAAPFPEVVPCRSCVSGIGSWKQLSMVLYGGDPFCLKTSTMLDYVEPDFFRAGSGTWGGKPQF